MENRAFRQSINHRANLSLILAWRPGRLIVARHCQTWQPEWLTRCCRIIAAGGKYTLASPYRAKQSEGETKSSEKSRYLCAVLSILHVRKLHTCELVVIWMASFWVHTRDAGHAMLCTAMQRHSDNEHLYRTEGPWLFRWNSCLLSTCDRIEGDNTTLGKKTADWRGQVELMMMIHSFWCIYPLWTRFFLAMTCITQVALSKVSK